MTGTAGPFVSRAEIARLAGVRRPAVTNWERRHEDFPEAVSVSSDDTALFAVPDMQAWLDGRAVPANAREEGEPAGTTYGDRFRAGLAGRGKARRPQAVEELVASGSDRLRGVMGSYGEYVVTLLVLVFLRGERPQQWEALTMRKGASDTAHAVGDVVEETLGRRFPWLVGETGKELLPWVVQRLRDDGPATSEEHAAAFDLVLSAYGSFAGKAGDLNTPPDVVDLAVDLLRMGEGNVRSLYDPFCRGGEMLAAALDAVRSAPGAACAPMPSVVGAGPADVALRLAGMNVALHGGEAELMSGMAPLAGLAPGQRFDRVVTNPPFNMRLPEYASPPAHWRYGKPGSSANYDWLQFVIESLAPGGRAAVVMAPHAAFVDSGRDSDIRSRMVEDGAVECLIALPPQLFTSTGIPVTLWVLRHPTGEGTEILFVDGSHLGTMTSRTQRTLSVDDKTLLADVHRGRRTTEGLSRVVGIEEIRASRYSLNPLQYTASDSPDLGRSSSREEVAALRARLRHLDEVRNLADDKVDELLKEYGL